MTFLNIAVMCLVSVKNNLSLKVRRVVGRSGKVIIYHSLYTKKYSYSRLF